MLIGILWAIFAGITLGLYALPEKFTKEFEFENTWGLFFAINMYVVPIAACLIFVNGFTEILSAIPATVLLGMSIAGFLWGIGVMMWGKAINYIGLSLGFSIFIGTVILVGSLIPFGVNGLPKGEVLVTILLGILIVLLGVIFNGKAGMLRQADDTSGKGSMGTGISIAVIGGLLATGFSYANAAGGEIIQTASTNQGNAPWVAPIVVMFVIYVAGGLFVIPYFIVQIRNKGLWTNFYTIHLGKNLTYTGIMAVLNFIAGVVFAYAAFKLGKAGNTVGYAIFNTVSVAVAIVSGLITSEWTTASPKAKSFLYMGLAAMVLGVVIIAFGNGM